MAAKNYMTWNSLSTPESRVSQWLRSLWDWLASKQRHPANDAQLTAMMAPSERGAGHGWVAASATPGAFMLEGPRGAHGSSYRPPPAAGSKKYAAFIALAHADMPLATGLRALLEELGLAVCIAEEKLPETGATKLHDEILQAIRDSACFILLLSRHSVIAQKQWVAYEIGAARALGATLYAARVEALSSREIQQLSVLGEVPLAYNLFREDGIAQLALSVFRTVVGREPDRAHIAMVKRSEHLKAILAAACERWVFIAGNMPRSEADLDRVVIEGKPGLSNTAKLEQIVGDLTRELLAKGFSVASCPEVDPIGRQAALAATKEIAERGQELANRYRIGGIYPVDRDKRGQSLSVEDRALWKELFERFRTSYLRDCKVLITLGGGAGTHEEAEAAQKLGIQVVTIAALGGTGRAISHLPGVCSPLPDLLVWNRKSLESLIAALER